jgi:hypothetical protein
VRVTSPFEDPEFAAALAGMGVVHAPGMAAAMMEELAPLLAAEGIDLNDLDEDIDLGGLNEALARASERHNLMLFTPVGAQRAGALAVLRLFAESFAEGDEDQAAAVLAGVGSEPVGDAPAVSHIIGVCLGLLDAWHTDPGLRAALAGTRVPRWNRAARAAATDVLALARKGRAFASLASLHRHGGLALFEGSVLLVAASLIARAGSEDASVRDLAGRVLAGSAPAEPPAPRLRRAAPPEAQGSGFLRPHPGVGAPGQRGRAGGHTVPRGMASADRALRRGFGAWLERAPSIAAPTVTEELELMQALVGIARGYGLDLHRAADVEPLVDLLWNADDPENPEALECALATLDDYVHVRLDAGYDLPGWEEAHEAVEDVLEDSGAGAGPLGAVLDDAEEIDPGVRRGALARTPLIAAVDGLLEWVGAGRAATQTGGVRRADIGHVAGMLGVRAVGVAKRLGSEVGEDAPVQALSMADVPLLADWWEALAAAEVIETASSRVRPGPAAAQWRAEGLPPLMLAETVAAMFVAQTLTAPLGQGAFGALIVQESIVQLMRALAPEDLDLDVTEPALPGGGPVWTLRDLERAGLLTGAGATGLEVPDGLRAAVARGLLAVLALLAGTDDE